MSPSAPVILDDGFQHLQIARDRDIVLVAAEKKNRGYRFQREDYVNVYLLWEMHRTFS